MTAQSVVISVISLGLLVSAQLVTQVTVSTCFRPCLAWPPPSLSLLAASLTSKGCGVLLPDALSCSHLLLTCACLQLTLLP